MAEEQSPESDGERAMFLPGDDQFVLVAERSGPGARRGILPLDETVGNRLPTDDDSYPPAIYAPPARSLRSRLLAFDPGLGRLTSAASISRTLKTDLSMELDRGLFFILAPVFLAIGILAYFSLRNEPTLMPLATGTGALLILTAFSRARPVLHLTLAAASLCILGALLAKAETWRASTKMLGGDITTQVTGRVVEAERMANGRVRLTIDVMGTERPVLRYAPERIRASVRKMPEAVTAGSVVKGLVRLMPPSGPVRPDSYDFSFGSYFNGIGASGFFMRGPELVAETGSPPPLATFRAAVERMRYAIAGRISTRIGGAEGQIAAALVVGVRAGIPEEVNDAMRRTGIYHVISISGLHMALVAGTIMGLLRAGFALFPGFSSRHPVKKYTAALALVGLSGYLFISGAEVAAQRSFIMIAVMLVAVLFDRAALTLRNLSISAIIVLAISPHEVVGPSFQMSFAATTALVGAYAAWSDWRGRHPRRPPENRSFLHRSARYVMVGMGGLAMTSIVAGGATAIYSAWHFQQMPSLGLFTNLTAMPVVSIIVMPFAVLGALAMPFGIDGPFWEVMGLGLTVMIAIAQWFAERSPLDIIGLVRPQGVAVLTAALLLATMFSTWLRVAAVPVAIVGLLLLPGQPAPDILVSEDGRLVGVDVGEGRIAVNRARPNAFTIENWKRAMSADVVVTPQGRQQAADAEGDAETSIDHPPIALDEVGDTFHCAGTTCLVRHRVGVVIAHSTGADAIPRLCAVAQVIVIEDATAKDACGPGVVVVTGRDLALKGSAAIDLVAAGSAAVTYAIKRPYRPWHDQRRFSRAARGLPPYRPGKARKQPADARKAPDIPQAESAKASQASMTGDEPQ